MNPETVNVPVRTVAVSIVGLWCAYFLLITARGWLIGLDFEFDLIWRRVAVTVAAGHDAALARHAHVQGAVGPEREEAGDLEVLDRDGEAVALADPDAGRDALGDRGHLGGGGGKGRGEGGEQEDG